MQGFIFLDRALPPQVGARPASRSASQIESGHRVVEKPNHLGRKLRLVFGDRQFASVRTSKPATANGEATTAFPAANASISLTRMPPPSRRGTTITAAASRNGTSESTAPVTVIGPPAMDVISSVGPAPATTSCASGRARRIRGKIERISHNAASTFGRCMKFPTKSRDGEATNGIEWPQRHRRAQRNANNPNALRQGSQGAPVALGEHHNRVDLPHHSPLVARPRSDFELAEKTTEADTMARGVARRGDAGLVLRQYQRRRAAVSSSSAYWPMTW